MRRYLVSACALRVPAVLLYRGFHEFWYNFCGGGVSTDFVTSPRPWPNLQQTLLTAPPPPLDHADSPMLAGDF